MDKPTWADHEIIAMLTGQPTDRIVESAYAREVGQMLIRDGLTGLYNRRYLQQRLSMELDWAGVANETCALCVVDLNGFKQINDLHGHHTGDLLLVQAANVLAQLTPPDGFVARYGGDEFVILLPGWKAEEVAEVARQLVASLRTSSIAGDGGKEIQGISASIGIAQWPQDARGYAELFEAADRAMYQAKRHVQGGVCLSRDLSKSPRQRLDHGVTPALSALLYCQVVDSSRSGPVDAPVLREVAARLDGLCARWVSEHGGTVFRPWDHDGRWGAAFPSTVDAAIVWARMCQVLPTHLLTPGLTIRLRGALHAGTCEVDQGEFTGSAVTHNYDLLMLANVGQCLVSAAAVARLEELLPVGWLIRDLGTHRLRDLRTTERIFELVDADHPAGVPPLLSLSVRPNNLPTMLTSFVGREWEINELKHQFRSTRLLTITGPGGCGKTRLALQVAADLIGQFADGVWLVELERLDDPHMVLPCVAAALGVEVRSGQPLAETLCTSLRSKRLLLVLDNCEHLIGACAVGVELLLRQCPDLYIMTTSREVLGIEGESVWRVPCLSLPTDPRLSDPSELWRYESVRLLMERARQHRPDFALSKQTAAAVAQICREVDGLPLAIELAAARLKTLSPGDLARRLVDRFAILSSGNRSLQPRQQTLRALVDWSYDLLTEPERMLWRRLTVFAGPFALAAAEGVCADAALPANSVFDLIAQLVDKSLVLVEESDGESRYRLLVTIRQYGLEKLQECGEGEVLRRKCLDWYAKKVAEVDVPINGSDQGSWLDWLEQEYDNLRAVLSWCRSDAAHVQAGLLIGTALHDFWYSRGHIVEGADLLGSLLEMELAPTGLRARALNTAGVLNFRLGAWDRVRAYWEEAIAIRRHLGETSGLAATLHNLAALEDSQGNYERARSLYEAALGLLRGLGDDYRTGAVMNNLGVMATHQGDYQRAADLLDESLRLRRTSEDKLGMAVSIHNLAVLTEERGEYDRANSLGQEALSRYRELNDRHCILAALDLLSTVSLQQGNFAEAEALQEANLAEWRALQSKSGVAEALHTLGWIDCLLHRSEAASARLGEALSLWQELGDQRGVARTTSVLAQVAFQEGNVERASELWSESLTLRQVVQDKKGSADTLERLAEVALAWGRAERAARLLGAAAGLRNRIGGPRLPVDQPAYERTVAAVENQLGSVAFQAAWTKGLEMDLSQAVTFVLRDDQFSSVNTIDPSFPR